MIGLHSIKSPLPCGPTISFSFHANLNLSALSPFVQIGTCNGKGLKKKGTVITSKSCKLSLVNCYKHYH